METGKVISKRKSTDRSWEYTAILTLTFLMAQASLMYSCYEAGYIEGTRGSGSFLTEFPYTLNGFHVLISLCLIICAIGFWLRKPSGLFISSTVLVAVFAIYGYWHFQTIQYLREFRAESQNYSRLQAEVGFFHGATKWDLAILALVAVLFSWLAVRLIEIASQKKSSAKC